MVLAKEPPKWINSLYAGWVLALISFAESVFAPIIIDPFLAALVLASRERWKYYVAISILGSTLGGIAAYLLGALFFDAVGQWLLESSGMERQFLYISDQLNNNSFAFVLLGAFSPIPYKLVALSSGLLHVNFMVFLVASLVGRTARLALAGYVAYTFGPYALNLFRQRFNLIFGILILLGLIFGLVRFF